MLAVYVNRKCWCVLILIINISLTILSNTEFINQSNFYSAIVPGEARLSDAAAESVFNKLW